jgi:diguanylate cyclase (GGDEF)-like protein
MVTIAYSAERAKKFDFSEVTAFNLWGQLYVRESSNISSYLDLDGKTIAVVRNNTHEKAIRNLLSQFGVKARFLEVANYGAVFEAIQSGQADAGAVGRFFGISREDEYSVKSTQLLFNPIEVRFAATKGQHKQLLADLDRHMTAMKADRHSVYYRALDGWLGITQKRALPNWLRLLFVIGGSILLVVAGIALALRLQVNSRTLHLQQEIAERKRYEAELEYQATYDSLTGLPNRMLLTDRIDQTMIQARRHGTVVPLILIDLDNFKIVNDTLGHDAGDDLLKQVSKRLLGAVRDSDTVARLGGDEFVVLPTDLVNAEDSITVAEKIMAAFAVPFNLGEREYFVTLSMGIAMFPQDGTTVEELMKYADAAMYHAKEQGKNNFQFFTEQINRRVHERLVMEASLRRALERQEYVLHYQPLVDLRTGAVNGAEALLRWCPVGEGMQSPASFIPLLEETGLIVPVGKWVLETACKQAVKWQAEGLAPLMLAINVSARQFHDDGFVGHVLGALEKSGLAHQNLRLELTESLLMIDADGAARKMRMLADLGILLSIDDFGTGYSSLSYLRNLPIHELKIDRSFIKSVTENKDDAVLVNTIIGMAESLNLRVVAEGVETIEQYNFLADQRCHEFQGFYFSKPLAPDSFADLLRSGYKLS